MRRKVYKWYRHPRTTAERRANQDGWCRGKRKPHSLPNTYWDLQVHGTKSWKDSRKKQYHTNGRGKHHYIKLPHQNVGWWHYGYHDDIWILEEYFKSHHIPYSIEKHRRFNWVQRYRWVKCGTKTIGGTDCIYTKNKWCKEYTGEFYRYWYIDHHIVHWWYNKDIGIEYILKDGFSNHAGVT